MKNLEYNFNSEEYAEDVEENTPKPPMNFKSAFGVVVALHVIVIGGILISSNNLKAKTQEIADDKKFITSNESVYVGEPEKVESNTFPHSDAPMVKTLPKPIETKIAESVTKPVQQPEAKKTEVKTKSKYTQIYQVKQGDNINSIAKKYHLVTNRLMKINNIKDPNKIYVGQTLKFL
jgi:LysM repeat protein